MEHFEKSFEKFTMISDPKYLIWYQVTIKILLNQ